MNDEEAVRAVLGIGKFTISNIYRAVKKVIDDKNRKLSKPIFNASEVLNENLSENKEAIKALEKEYKQNGVDFKTRELPDGKTELLFHAKDKNMILATTEKIMKDIQENPKKYIKKEHVFTKEPRKSKTMQERIANAKAKEQQLLKAKGVNKAVSKGKGMDLEM